MHKTKFLFSLEFIDCDQLAVHLMEIASLAKLEKLPNPRVEMQMDGDASRADVWEETLSDSSKQWVIQLC